MTTWCLKSFYMYVICKSCKYQVYMYHNHIDQRRSLRIKVHGNYPFVHINFPVVNVELLPDSLRVKRSCFRCAQFILQRLQLMHNRSLTHLHNQRHHSPLSCPWDQVPGVHGHCKVIIPHPILNQQHFPVIVLEDMFSPRPWTYGGVLVDYYGFKAQHKANYLSWCIPTCLHFCHLIL